MENTTFIPGGEIFSLGLPWSLGAFCYMTALTLNLNPIIQLTGQQFYQLCQENPDVRLEHNAAGELIIMPPAGGETGKRNVKLSKYGL